MLNKTVVFLIIFAISASFAGCNINEQGEPVVKNLFAFDTYITMTIYKYENDNINKVIKEAEDRIEKYDELFSAHSDNNELYSVNKSAFKEEIQISDQLFLLTKKAIYLSEISGGAFDFTIGNLSSMWGFGSDNAKLPSKAEIYEYKQLDNWKNVVLDHDKKTIRFLDERINLDFGGIAKGYAGGLVRDFLIESGVKSALLDFGGNIITIGNKNGQPWNIGISSPETNEITTTVQIEQSSVSTSNGSQRFIEADGVRYHHILDPKTGYPANSSIKSCTAISQDTALADGLSTACFILGKDKTVELLEKTENAYCVLILDDGTVINTKRD